MSEPRAIIHSDSAPVIDLSLVEKTVIQGDLKELKPAERAAYYAKVCESIGLNPFTRPFDYIILNNKLTLYARKDATDQLRRKHNVCVQIVSRETVNDCYIVTARATMPNGRADEEIGAVSIKGLQADALCNALMKGVTKAKRRVTLSIVGLGWLDETEVDSIPGVQYVTVDRSTGEILTDTTPAPVVTSVRTVEPVQSPTNGKSKKIPTLDERKDALAALMHKKGFDVEQLRWLLKSIDAEETDEARVKACAARYKDIKADACTPETLQKEIDFAPESEPAESELDKFADPFADEAPSGLGNEGRV